MRLLRLEDVEIRRDDAVFRHARLRALIVWLAGLAASAALFFQGYAHRWPPGYIFGSFLGLFLLLTLRFVTARFHASNWLVRMNQTGIYVQYRSYLNYELPGDEPSSSFCRSARLPRHAPYGSASKPRIRQGQAARKPNSCATSN